MSPKHQPTVAALKDWVSKYCKVNVPMFKRNNYQQYAPGDVFIGYHEDVIPGLVMQICQNEKDIEGEALVQRVKQQLLLCATPDSVIRTKDTYLAEETEELFETYFLRQSHDSLANYLSHQQEQISLMQVTTHSRLLTATSKDDLANFLSIRPGNITLLSVQQFRTEEEFRKRARKFLSDCKNAKEEDGSRRILVAQIEAGTTTSNNLTECAKYVIQEVTRDLSVNCQVSIVLVVHVPRVAGGCHVGFPGQPWNCIHIDELRTPESRHQMKVQAMRNRSIFQLIEGEVDHENGILSVEDLLDSVVPKAASMLKGGQPSRQTERIDKFLSALENKPFRQIALMHLKNLIEVKNKHTAEPEKWLSNMVLYSMTLKEGNTFRSAVWQHLQNYITPAVAHLMACIDTNANLNNFELEDWKGGMFLRIFKSSNIRDSFEPVVVERNREVQVKQTGSDGFSNVVPFSWILHSYIDHCQQQADSVHHAEKLVLSSGLGEALQEVWSVQGMKDAYVFDFLEMKLPEHSGQVYDYLKDFLESQIELMNNQAVTRAVVSESEEDDCEAEDDLKDDPVGANRQDEVESKMDVEDSFVVENIPCDLNPATLHYVYNILEKNILPFSSLLSKHKDSVTEVLAHLAGKESERIDLLALEAILDNKFKPNFANFDRAEVRDTWSSNVQNIQPQVEHILSFRTECESQELLRTIQASWTRIQIVSMFLHHVTPPQTDQKLVETVLGKLKMLWQSLKNVNLKKHKSFNNLASVLKLINKHAAQLHYSGGVSECIRCEEAPKDAVALPCGHVGCASCIEEFIKRSKTRRCPKRNCKSPDIPELFEIRPTYDVEQAVERHGKFRTNLNLFFMDVLDQFCFDSAQHPPAQEVLETLLSFTVKQNEDEVKTKQVSPFNEHGIDSSLVVRYDFIYFRQRWY